MPTFLIAAFAVLLGLIFGSFLNVCIARLPLRQSIVTPRSRCPRCGHAIAAKDNLPLISWLLLRGRCRHCAERISLRYPLVEVAMAGLFLLCFLLYGLTVDAVAAAIFCFFMVGLCVTDAETYRLPDTLTLPALILGVIWRMVDNSIGAPHPWRAAAAVGLRASISAAGAALGLLLIRALYFAIRRRVGMGLGDVKLAAAIAAWLGIRQFLLVFFLAVVSGAIVGVVVFSLRRKQQEEPARVPLGSFLCLAAIYTEFQGYVILNWYLSLFR
jgi:leader peptidase (prepilin peptidase)/N-methyltransferase